MSKKFEYYQIYGDVSNLPVGVVHKENLGKETPEQIAERVLSKYGMSNFTAVEKSEDEKEFKVGGGSIDFYNNEDSYFELSWVNDKTPAIILHQNARGPKKSKGKGIAFSDEESFDLFVSKVLQAYIAYKGRG